MKAALFGGLRKGTGGTAAAATARDNGAEGAPGVAGAEGEDIASAPAATAPCAVSPVVARMLRRAAAGNAGWRVPTKEVAKASPVPSGRSETAAGFRTFSSSKRDITGTAASPTDRRDDEVFRKRLAMQRASNIWSPLIVAWFDAPESSRGAWSLHDLMAAIRAEAKGMAEAGLATGGNDERLVVSLTAMLAKAVACELRTAFGNEGFLRRDAVRDASAALRGILDEPPAATLREPPSDGLHVRGRTSLAISTADIAARLLPPIGRHAGLATGEVLEVVLGEIRRRSRDLAAAILPDTATERDRQSLVQSLMRREAEVMASCLERLPPAGIGSLVHGRAPVDQAIERYRLRSDALKREIERVARAPHDPINDEGAPVAPRETAARCPSPSAGP